MKCSVVMPTYNRAGLLRHTLDALVRQTLPMQQFEVLVVDDGSTDDTPSLVDSYTDRLNIRYFSQEHQGYRVARARNVGIRHAAGEICVFVDSGVLLHSGALAAHVDSHRNSEAPIGVSGYVYCFNENNEDGELISKTIDYADPDGTIASLTEQKRWLDIREEFYEKYGDEFGYLPAPWLMFWTCNASARTAQIKEVGMFDEAYQAWGAEDVDLSYRLFHNGARFTVNRQASSIHCPHPKSQEDNLRSAMGNYRYFASKYGTPVAQLVVGNHFHVINDIIRERGLRDE